MSVSLAAIRAPYRSCETFLNRIANYADMAQTLISNQDVKWRSGMVGEETMTLWKNYARLHSGFSKIKLVISRHL
ncbi:uncharacterized protein PHALS_03208 [Plasmopara halstedii]|uniref:Uncharacterized protein n=1 Tax=Plasmopara halstedii TaxID=4781 RepID=A0A0P1AX50_PLAHL|nr:uncharacterized protein PHALS_03208 [Plasmopara halstedii]CEG46608.1 hypothetical protein PHALS_03208 [Plasmopara halstedii]|eukprot:XP_024582977.1 hypothetical protein PHALS_03208 [Plasmopara halstedii]